MELLQYLDMEQSWLNTVEDKVQATENLPESTEAVSEALEVHTHTHTHIVNTFSSSFLILLFLCLKVQFLRINTILPFYTESLLSSNIIIRPLNFFAEWL